MCRLFHIRRQTRPVPDSQAKNFFASVPINGLFISIKKEQLVQSVGGLDLSIFMPYCAYTNLISPKGIFELTKAPFAVY